MAFWCDGCSPDNCCGCDSPPLEGSVVRVGGHAAKRNAAGGGVYVGRVTAVVTPFGVPREVTFESRAGEEPTALPIAWLYPCAAPSPEWLEAREREARDVAELFA